MPKKKVAKKVAKKTLKPKARANKDYARIVHSVNRNTFREYHVDDFREEAKRLKSDPYKIMAERAKAFAEKLTERSNNDDEFRYEIPIVTE